MITKITNIDQSDFKWKVCLKRHINCVHGNVRYACEQCNYKATQTHSLKRHIVTVHEGVWHSCGQCDYKTKWNNNLKIHIDSVRGDMQYSCERKNRMVSSHMFMEVYGTVLICVISRQYGNVISKATQKVHHKRHIDAVHGDVRYSCDQCDYKSKWKGHLKKHIDSVYGEVRYSCDQCDFFSKRKGNLKNGK